MDKELQKQLSESVKSFADSIGSVKDFALDQAPDVIHQFLMWAVVESVLAIFISFAAIFISYKATFKWTNQKPDYFECWATDKVIVSLAGASISIFSAIYIVIAIMNIAQIAIAPKIFLIEKAASLIK